MSALKLGLSPAQLAARRDGIGGSDAGKIMDGDWLSLWQEKTGRRESEDLSDVLPVQIGLITEPLNVHWFERRMGQRVTAQGEIRRHPQYPFMRCTLDGLTSRPAVLECKHVNAFARLDEVVQRYMPQVHHEMAVTGLDMAYLSVFLGTLTYECVEIALDDFYLARLIDREREFWFHVEADTPPPDRTSVAAPVPPAQFRTLDMNGNNEWAALAGDWLATKASAAAFHSAAKALKSLVDPDVGEAHGYGIRVTRGKNSALTIKEA